SSPRTVNSDTNWTHVQLGPAGRHLAAWHVDHAHIYSLPDFHHVLRTSDQIGGGAVLGTSFSSDESLLALSRWSNDRIFIWDIARSNLVQTIHLTYSLGGVNGRSEFTQNGRWLFVSTQVDLRLYDPVNWTLRASVPWEGGANQLAFLAGGNV